MDEGKPAPCREGVQIQDEASQLIPYLFGPIEGGMIWDACAAPGGKSAILRERCGSAGWVLSSDLNLRRAQKMREALLSCSGARSDVLVADARSAFPFRKQFDAVLLDVPCSGLGTMRRNPELKWRLAPSRLAELGRRQLQLLGSGAAAVRKGGLLLYSTCSTEPEENESVAKCFLQSNSEFRALKPEFPSGLGAWLDSEGMFRSFPSSRLWDGFFAALMVRVS